MSWLSKYVFNPIEAVFARASSSAVPPSAILTQTGQTALAQVGAAAQTIVAQAAAGTLTANSAIGAGNALVGQLEDTLKSGVDTLVTGLVGEVPVAGAFLAPEAVNMANVSLAFLESHAHDYIASLFSHAKTQIVASGTATPA